MDHQALACDEKISIFEGMSAQIINTALYPLDHLGSNDGQALLKRVRTSLQQNGSCTLPDFVSAEVLQQMADEARSITHLAYPGPTEVTPYFFNYRLGEGETLPDSHPLRRKGKRRLGQVATDLIPTDFMLSLLHRSPAMREFLSAVLQQPVYQSRDPYQSLNISVMDAGGCQQWHFDGGNDDDENFEAVQAVLDGKSDRVIQNPLRAGTLSLFRGHYSMHRVTEVVGKRQRLQAILGYSTNPAMFGKLESSILHYGPRVADIEASDPRYPQAS
jgi:hypothetical protein